LGATVANADMFGDMQKKNEEQKASAEKGLPSLSLPDFGLSNTAKDTGIGAAIGCAGGAVLSKITGNGLGKGCLVGAVAGGVVRYIKGRDQDLQEAQKVEQEIRDIKPVGKDDGGYTPVVTKKTEKVTVEETKEVKEVLVLDKFEVPLKQASLDSKSDDSAKVLNKIGKLASVNSTDSKIQIQAKAQNKEFIIAKIKEGIVEPLHKIDITFTAVTKNPKIVMTPIPNVEVATK
jgi:hypothetical protein